jgi:sugar phosphate isomerase/epimerase
MTQQTRRQFIAHSAAATSALYLGSQLARVASAEDKEPWFKISLAEWSLHRTINSGALDNRDFAKTAKERFGISAIEYVNQFFKDKAKNKDYIAELKNRADDLDVKTLLIMIDGEGQLGDPDEKQRMVAVENHYQWVEAAEQLGCHSIRVNAATGGNASDDDKAKMAADGLSKLSEFAAGHGLNVIVENHGGLSSNGKWLAKVMKLVDRKNCGTLPDFGNFRIGNGQEYDRYEGVTELMPFAKAVSAKSHDFNDAGDETHTDYSKMMKIVKEAGYRGYVGIEYEGSTLDEYAGIAATQKLLEKVRTELS